MRHFQVRHYAIAKGAGAKHVVFEGIDASIYGKRTCGLASTEILRNNYITQLRELQSNSRFLRSKERQREKGREMGSERKRRGEKRVMMDDSELSTGRRDRTTLTARAIQVDKVNK